MSEKKQISDTEWILSLRKGDEVAFNELFDHYARRLYRFSMTYLKSEQDAEEIVQDVFMKIWNKRKELSEEKSFDSYIFTIARNAILNTIRKSKSEQVYCAYARLHPNKDILLDDELDFNELEKAYRYAIEKLSPRRKEIYQLSRDKSLSYAEIASQLGISVKTVENQMTVAIADIRRTLQSLGFAGLIYAYLFV